MSWGMHEAAKKIASGWYSELDTTRERNADLGRENEKLREENERFIIKLNAEHIVRQNVESENAKLRDKLEEQKCFAADLERDVRALRELVLDMWPHVRYRSRMCGECELPCDTSDECLLYEPMRQRMRKLGVEVDE